MTFEIGALIAFVVAVVGAAIGYGRLSKNADANEKEVENLWKVINSQRTKLEEHEVESGKVRLQIEKDLGLIREAAVKGDGRFDIIMSQLEDIKKKIDKLEDSKH